MSGAVACMRQADVPGLWKRKVMLILEVYPFCSSTEMGFCSTSHLGRNTSSALTVGTLPRQRHRTPLVTHVCLNFS